MALIKCDIDGYGGILGWLRLAYDLNKRKFYIRDILKLKIELLSVCKTKRGWHLVYSISRELTDTELVILQMALLSDVKRELFNLKRIWNGQDMQTWNILFVQKFQIQNGKLRLISSENDGIYVQLFKAAYKLIKKVMK
jgi:hypothetical protein